MTVDRVADLPERERRALARRGGDLPLQRTLAADPSRNVRRILAANPDLDPSVFTTLAHDPEQRVVGALAANPSLPPPLMRMLVNQDSRVLDRLATNSSLPPDVMLTLADHPQWSVRFTLATNPTVTELAQERLRADGDLHVLSALVDNPQFTFTPTLPLASFQRGDLGRVMVRCYLADCDPAVLSVLEPSWSGTLKELRAAALSFS